MDKSSRKLSRRKRTREYETTDKRLEVKLKKAVSHLKDALYISMDPKGWAHVEPIMKELEQKKLITKYFGDRASIQYLGGRKKGEGDNIMLLNKHGTAYT